MQPVNSPDTRCGGRHVAPRLAAALLAVSALCGGLAPQAAAACPWIVQPFAETVQMSKQEPAFDIVYDGLEHEAKVFYAFTVASLDLAWQMTTEPRLPQLRTDARKLEPKATPLGTTAYQVARDTIQPHTIYLVAATAPVEALEQIDARIEPARPLAVSQLLPRIRGGSDWSGPLPHRSLPGYEISSLSSGASGASSATGAAGPTRGAADDAPPDEPQLAAADVQVCAYEVAMR
jgi:hypothetical protein